MMQALPSFASLRLRTHNASSLNIFIFSVLLWTQRTIEATFSSKGGEGVTN